jgi:hypothetical protein
VKRFEIQGVRPLVSVGFGLALSHSEMSTVTPTTSGIEDLRARLGALRTRFVKVGTLAARRAAEIAAGGAPPSEEFLAELTATNADFHALRDELLEHVARLEVVLPKPADAVASLRDLVPVVEAIAATLAGGERNRRAEAARAAALHVIDRVQAIKHHDDPAFAPLADCQGKARALHKEIAASAATDSDVVRWAERLQPFADLLDMLEDESVVDDERVTQLADNVAAAFGRPLATAALRGRLRLR